MKNLQKFQTFVNEWLDSPGSIDVPGPAAEVRVNSRNYTPNNPQMPEVLDAMYEASFFTDFLEDTGKSESFNEYLKKESRSASEITRFIKRRFQEETMNKKS